MGEHQISGRYFVTKEVEQVKESRWFGLSSETVDKYRVRVLDYNGKLSESSVLLDSDIRRIVVSCTFTMPSGSQATDFLLLSEKGIVGRMQMKEM